MQMHCKDRLAEIECLTQPAYIQRTEVHYRRGTQRVISPKGNLANGPDLMEGNEVLT
ncbi:hypothetical protein PPUJ20028_07740 [Pseudomonas putida]|uniref:Uncharacterized protein n=1 Tax=Pseudomonas putida TaxID=303 RepID=A0AA37RF34_PSEPU|nr:hypothetical protein PPUJ20028_07740 [Pseudomonas putida]GLO35424.1 hypothetical protein PPUN14671_22570 [Pseudomonas putida]